MDAFVMLQELLEQEQFELIFPERSISGQPRANAYQIISDAKIAIGLEILPHTTHILSINLYGKMIAKETLPVSFEASAAYFSKLKKAVKNFCQINHHKAESILGIGLGVQGLISPRLSWLY